jgi:beta-glucosidase
VTALQGLERAQSAYGIGRILTGDESDLVAATEAAHAADAILVVAGYTAHEEGEFIPGDINLGQNVSDDVKAVARKTALGGDRDSLSLPADQIELIRIAAQSGKPVVVVMVAGSAVMVEEWHDQASAILQTFYSGMEGGTALARLLFGDVSPSGKLPFSVARDTAHYPHFDKDAAEIRYDLWHGYSKLDRDGMEPRYAFGHGLSYAKFEHFDLSASLEGEMVIVETSVRNSGKVAADEIVQIYVGPPGKAVERQTKLLKGFRRVSLAPGEEKRMTFAIAHNDLRWRNAETHGWELETGTYRIMAGGSSDRLRTISLNL